MAAGASAAGVVDVSALVLAESGFRPAGREGAASRLRALAFVLALATGAALSGAVFGLLKQPDPGRAGAQSLYTAAAAVETARTADSHARDLERQLAESQSQLAQARSRLTAPDVSSALQDAQDLQEAERIGIPRFMKDSTALWGDDRRRVEIAIVREARRNGLDPLLVAAVIQVESHFNPFAVSGVGACGLMQLMPPTARWLQDKQPDDDRAGKLARAHLFNPVLNIKLGTAYLAQLMQRFDGDLNRALIAYNAGPTTAHAITPHSKAWRRLSSYPRSVLAAYRTLLLPAQQIAAR
jgi:soluble lytic murein transglycosylase